jgi:hypothetical protein
MTPARMQVIRGLDFFEPLDNGIIKEIARQCFDRQFAPGDFIVRQGEPGLGLYFICSGRARVEIDHQGSLVTAAELSTGDCVGELSIVDDKARSASVVCVESTVCLLLTRDSFSRLINKHPQLAIQMVKALAARLRATNHRIVGPAKTPAPEIPQPRSSPAPAEASGHPFLPLPLMRPSELIESYTTTKGKVKDLLIDVFSPIYAARTMTRFSMAVIGCPVTVRPENAEFSSPIGIVHDVKVCLLPAGAHQTLSIGAYDDGDVSVTVLNAAGSHHFCARIQRNQNWRLHVPPDSPIWMEGTHGEAILARDSR